MTTEQSNRIHVLLTDIGVKDRCTQAQLHEMYFLHNDLAKEMKWPMEYSKHCPSCNARVKKRLTILWEEQIKTTQDEGTTDDDNDGGA